MTCQQHFDTNQSLTAHGFLDTLDRPREIGFDNGGEFKVEFKEFCANLILKEKISLYWSL